jgi:subtilisin-like proprotein convertase family protein
VAAATAPPPSGGGSRSKLIAIIAVAVAAVAAVIIGVIALGGGDEPEPPPPTGPTGQVPPEPTVLSNAEAITIPDSGPATPYPSTIEVSGLQGTVSDVNVTVTGLTHGFPDDVDMLLVGPGGQNVVLAADAGGGEDANAQTLTFDDGAAGTLRDENAPRSDAVRPQSFGLGFEGPAPAPAAPFGETLAVFNGTDPNGTWQLFVFDDAGSDEGEIAGGWSLEITVDPAGTPPTGATGPSEATFSNTAAMTIPDFGQAVPYPSEIEVSGMGDSIVDVNVTLVGLSHSFLEDLGVLVVGPTGENTVLMARAGGFRNANDRTLTFDDQATEVLRDERPPVGDLVRPQAFEPGFEGEPPAPEPPFGETLAVFNGTDPNGTWQLFVFDAGAGDLGEITGGWSLTITVG